MRSVFTVYATAQTKAASHFAVIRRLSRAMLRSYNSSRGGTRTPDPVINRHLSSAERTPQHPLSGVTQQYNRTGADRNSLHPATVCATAFQRPDPYADPKIFLIWKVVA
jgi:hypothetical protein